MFLFLGRAGLASVAACVGLTVPLAIPLAVPAAADQGSKPMALDAVVVTGTRTETSVKDSPVAITVVGSDEIEKANATNIGDVLRDVPGITLDESSLAGLKRLKIRGEEARRGAVLIDGQEITDHTSYGSPILVDPALIERIEVVRGPHSVLYGSKAIAGVVNIITKKGGDRPVQGSVGGSFLSATDGYSSNALVRGAADGWEYRLFGGRVEEDNRETARETLPRSDAENRSVSGYIAHGWENQKLALGFDRFESSSGSNTSPSTIGSAFSKFQLDMVRRDLQKFSVNYDLKKPSDLLGKVHVDAYYQTVDRKFTQDVASGSAIPGAAAYDYFHVDQDVQGTMGGTFQMDWTPHPDHLLVTGFQFIRDDLDKNLYRNGRRGVGLATPVSSFALMEAHTQTASLYAQDTWKLPADFSLVAGARHYWIESQLDELTTNDTGYKKRRNADNAPIGSVALLYSGIPDTTLRAGFAQGYVYPTLLQAFTGTYFGTSSSVRPNPSLEPETSRNYEIGARYAAGGAMIDTSLFLSHSSNYIASATCASAPHVCGTASESTYINIDRAKTMGLELAAQYAIPDSGFTPYLSGTLLQREYRFRSVETSETGVPSASGRIGVRHEMMVWDEVALSSDFYMRGGSRADELTQSSSGSTSTTQVGGWRTFNLSFGADVNNIHVGLSLINLTNHYYRTSPDEMAQPGRSFILGLRVDL